MAKTATMATDSRTNNHSHYYSASMTPTSTISLSSTQRPHKTKIRSTSNASVDLDDPGSYSYHPTAAMVEAAKIDYAHRLFIYTLEKLCKLSGDFFINDNCNITNAVTNRTITRGAVSNRDAKPLAQADSSSYLACGKKKVFSISLSRSSCCIGGVQKINGFLSSSF
ncbi:10354_t:CDS:2 [Ambispora leptoticha]|uniref:10354_t:CDS:1 n=1 Tax=Ambispora leptoticha TaxID=144679 RepID=A0A9N8ZCU2_9GLOM|nr:10354_t:CDS:2 [Ambispora leptoticha]